MLAQLGSQNVGPDETVAFGEVGGDHSPPSAVLERRRRGEPCPLTRRAKALGTAAADAGKVPETFAWASTIAPGAGSCTAAGKTSVSTER